MLAPCLVDADQRSPIWRTSESQLAAKSARGGPNLANTGKLWSNLANLAQSRDESWPNMGHVPSMLAKVRQTLPKQLTLGPNMG